MSVKKNTTKIFSKAKKKIKKIKMKSDRKKMIEGGIVKTVHYRNYLIWHK